MCTTASASAAAPTVSRYDREPDAGRRTRRRRRSERAAGGRRTRGVRETRATRSRSGRNATSARVATTVTLRRCASRRRPRRRERHDEGERDEQRRQVQHDGCCVDPGELGDEGENAVPERERVAGMQAPVAKLVDDAERRQLRRLGELADTCEMEERVAVDDRRRPPDDCPERHPRGHERGDRQRARRVRGERDRAGGAEARPRARRPRALPRCRSRASGDPFARNVTPIATRTSHEPPGQRSRPPPGRSAPASRSRAGSNAPGTSTTHANAAARRIARPAPSAGRTRDRARTAQAPTRHCGDRRRRGSSATGARTHPRSWAAVSPSGLRARTQPPYTSRDVRCGHDLGITFPVALDEQTP